MFPLRCLIYCLYSHGLKPAEVHHGHNYTKEKKEHSLTPECRVMFRSPDKECNIPLEQEEKADLVITRRMHPKQAELEKQYGN